MRIITFGIVLAATCQAQIAFVPSRPGNWTPTKPIFGVMYGSAGDTINDRSIKNLGSAPIVIEAVSLEIKSPGLEGEWRGDVSVDGLTESGDMQAQRVQFKKVMGVTITHMSSNMQLSDASLSPQATADLSVDQLTDCYWPCTVDNSVKPPVPLFKYNTANPVDTIEARLGVYWRDQNTDTYDSAFLDCRIEYRIGDHSEGTLYRSNSPGAARPVGVAGGWRVEFGAWSLRRPNGAEVPLGRQATAQGLEVRPTTDFKGIGILHNTDGQAFRVVGVR